MADNPVLARWAEGAAAIAGWMSTHSLLIAQAVAATGVDAVIVDMQHGSATLEDMLALIASIEVRGAEAFVRVPSIDASLIGRLLDAGATGMIAPLVDSAEQAQALVAAMRYPPAGCRSYGPRIPAIRHGAGYFQIANEGNIALAMIETSAGLGALDEIAAVEGLSGLFVGPSDLAVSLGRAPSPGDVPENVRSAIDRIRARATAAGKRAGIFCPNFAAAASAIEAGFDLVTTIPDLSLVDSGTRASVKSLRNLSAVKN